MVAATLTSSKSRRLKPAWRVFVGVGLVYLAVLPPGISDLDGNSMFSMAHSIWTRWRLDVPCDLGVPAQDGHCYSVWYPLLPMLAGPLVLAGRLFAGIAGLPSLPLERAAVLVVPAIAGAGAAAVTSLIGWRFSHDWRRATFSALAFAFGTEALVYSRSFFAETLAALLLATGVWSLASKERNLRPRLIAGLAFAAAILAKPQMAVPALAVAGLLFVTERRRRSLVPLAGVIAGVLLYSIYNLARWGSLFTFQGPAGTQASLSQMPEGAAVLLISPGRGLLIFSPVAALGIYALWRVRKTPLGRYSLVACLGLLCIYATHTGSGSDWGDRFLVPALPFLCAALTVLRGKVVRVAVALAMLGAAIQLPATASFWQRYYREQAALGVTPAELTWSLTKTPLVGAWGSMFRQFEAASDSDPGELIRESGESTGDAEQAQLLKTVPMWWWFLPAVGVSMWVGITISLLAILFGIRFLRPP